jgi:hypothetical protein
MSVLWVAYATHNTLKSVPKNSKYEYRHGAHDDKVDDSVSYFLIVWGFKDVL